jgi:hypothetical protein
MAPPTERDLGLNTVQLRLYQERIAAITAILNDRAGGQKDGEEEGLSFQTDAMVGRALARQRGEAVIRPFDAGLFAKQQRKAEVEGPYTEEFVKEVIWDIAHGIQPYTSLIKPQLGIDQEAPEEEVPVRIYRPLEYIYNNIWMNLFTGPTPQSVSIASEKMVGQPRDVQIIYQHINDYQKILRRFPYHLLRQDRITALRDQLIAQNIINRGDVNTAILDSLNLSEHRLSLAATGHSGTYTQAIVPVVKGEENNIRSAALGQHDRVQNPLFVNLPSHLLNPEFIDEPAAKAILDRQDKLEKGFAVSNPSNQTLNDFINNRFIARDREPQPVAPEYREDTDITPDPFLYGDDRKAPTIPTFRSFYDLPDDIQTDLRDAVKEGFANIDNALKNFPDAQIYSAKQKLLDHIIQTELPTFTKDYYAGEKADNQIDFADAAKEFDELLQERTIDPTTRRKFIDFYLEAYNNYVNDNLGITPPKRQVMYWLTGIENEEEATNSFNSRIEDLESSFSASEQLTTAWSNITDITKARNALKSYLGENYDALSPDDRTEFAGHLLREAQNPTTEKPSAFLDQFKPDFDYRISEEARIKKWVEDIKAGRAPTGAPRLDATGLVPNVFVPPSGEEWGLLDPRVRAALEAQEKAKFEAEKSALSSIQNNPGKLVTELLYGNEIDPRLVTSKDIESLESTVAGLAFQPGISSSDIRDILNSHIKTNATQLGINYQAFEASDLLFDVNKIQDAIRQEAINLGILTPYPTTSAEMEYRDNFETTVLPNITAHLQEFGRKTPFTDPADLTEFIKRAFAPGPIEAMGISPYHISPEGYERQMGVFPPTPTAAGLFGTEIYERRGETPPQNRAELEAAARAVFEQDPFPGMPTGALHAEQPYPAAQITPLLQEAAGESPLYRSYLEAQIPDLQKGYRDEFREALTGYVPYDKPRGFLPQLEEEEEKNRQRLRAIDEKMMPLQSTLQTYKEEGQDVSDIELQLAELEKQRYEKQDKLETTRMYQKVWARESRSPRLAPTQTFPEFFGKELPGIRERYELTPSAISEAERTRRRALTRGRTMVR